MEDLFKRFTIRFNDRNDFAHATNMNNLADDIGHSDMIMVYSNEFFRDRFFGFLITSGIEDIEKGN